MHEIEHLLGYTCAKIYVQSCTVYIGFVKLSRPVVHA